jgi:hypothetical protein
MPNLCSGAGVLERRKNPRINVLFPVSVRVNDENGQDYHAETVLDNLSAGGCYLRLPRKPDPGAKIFTVVRLSTAQERKARAPLVAAKGVIARLEPQADGSWGVAVCFKHHRFL